MLSTSKQVIDSIKVFYPENCQSINPDSLNLATIEIDGVQITLTLDSETISTLKQVINSIDSDSYPNCNHIFFNVADNYYLPTYKCPRGRIFEFIDSRLKFIGILKNNFSRCFQFFQS